MANDEMLTDDYVAGLLAKDASDCSLKFSAMGMEAFRSDKKPASMPKPNKRFLRHIIKDTDSHNKALLAKEAAESKARLKDLERAEEAKRRKTNPNTRDIRRRQMGDIHAILGGKRRPRDEEDRSSGRESRKPDSKSHDSERPSPRDKDLTKERHRERRHHGRLDRGDEESTISGSSRRHHDRGRARTSDEGLSSEEERKHRHSRRRRERSRSRSPKRRRSHSPRERRSTHRDRTPLDNTTRRSKSDTQRREDDSDPLDDFIGPAPPARYRGRGTIGGAAALDRRFSESYDPKTDVQMDDDGNPRGDWDDAVEAFRDRQKLRQHQEERLRAAGFATKQIEKVAASGAERKEEDVRWAKAGESREWDRGKEVGSDGDVPSP